MIPGTISHYRILEKLGAGGMGEVYKARDTSLERHVAIKFLPPEELRQPGALERFLREARAAAALDHPHITAIHEIGEADGHTFIVMKYVQGETLQARVRREPASMQQALEWGIQIADALAEAHACGVVHRDIKSTNIMITPKNQVEILDFGLAKKLPQLLVAGEGGDETRVLGDSLTQAGTVVGTVEYLAPELLRGEAADARSDVFSLGVVLYETLTGQRAFAGKTAAATMNAILELEPPPLSRYAGDVPPELERIVRKALAKDRDRRYQSAQDCRVDLEELHQALAAEAFLQRSSQGRRLPSGPMAVSDTPGGATPLSSTSGLPDSRRVPVLPPLPAPRWQWILVAAALASGVALFAFPPSPYRSIARFTQSPAQVESLARGSLARHGVSLYGYSSYTDADGDTKLRHFESHEHLSSDELRQIETWSPLAWYRTLVASADHEDRYELHTSPENRLIAISHDLRPDKVSVTVSADSAAVLARDVLTNDFGLDLRLFEALPPAETIAEARRVREFRWRLLQPLPRGAVGTAWVRLSGPDLVESKLQVELPPAVMRTIEQEKDLLSTAGAIFLGLCVVGALVVAMRNRYFLFPGMRSFFLVTLGIGVVTVASTEFRRMLVEKGPWQIFTTLAGKVLSAPLIALFVFAVWGFSVAALGAERPALIAGLGDVLRLRVSRSTWARSAVVGLTFGALLCVFLTYAPWLLAALGAGTWWPHPVQPHAPRPWGFLLEGLTIATFLGSVALGGGVAVAVLLQRALRLRIWIWLLAVLLMAATTTGNSQEIQPSLLHVLVTGVGASVILFVTIRFGILAGVFAVVAQGVLATAAALAPARIPYLRLEAGLAVAAWLTALVWSLYATRSSRSRAA